MSRSKATLLPPGVQPLAVRVGTMAAMIGVSEETFMQMRDQGIVSAPRVFGSTKLYIVNEVLTAISTLPFEPEASDAATERPWKVQ
jgi:hypothetical protein